MSDAAPIAIDDLDDPRLEPFRDVREKDLRGRDHLFIGESEAVLRRLLRTPERLHSILVTPAKHDRLREALRALPRTIPVYTLDLYAMGRLAGFHVHRGVLAAGHRPARDELTLHAALGHLRDIPKCTIVIAEGLTNVDNIGAVFRNAAAFGVDGIILDPTCCDPLYRKAIRVSMGHTLSTPYAIAERWPDDLDILREAWGVTIIASECTGTSTPAWTRRPPVRRALLLGAESTGVAATTLDRCDHVHHIPMAPGVPSLNVAVASAVMLYEWSRMDGPA